MIIRYRKVCLFITELFLFAGGFGQAGTAPVSIPSGGLSIDGFLQRQGVGGDWLAGPGGSQAGTFVVSNIGVPLVPLLGHSVDIWDSKDNILSKASMNGDPNSFRWTLKKAQPSTDINNFYFFLTKDDQQHAWVALTADRFSTSNSVTYLDFEFLQKPLFSVSDVDESNSGGTITGGRFISYGVQGGRTIGDILITLGFNTRGSFSSIFYYQWGRVSNGVYAYQPLVPPAGSAFGAVNATEINVPFGAFGSTTYPAQTFGEVALDMTAITGGLTCVNLENTFRTIWVRSKKDPGLNGGKYDDFVSPFQLGVSNDFSLTADYQFYDLFTAQLTASPSPGTINEYNFHWEPVGTLINDQVDPTITGRLDDYDIYNPVFSADPDHTCIPYLYEVSIATKENPGCIVARYALVINSPCKIGKPINPDRPHLQQDRLGENTGSKGEIIVFPNPSTGTATIILPGNEASDIELLDIKGSVVQRWRQFTGNSIQFKNQLPGLYLIKTTINSNGKVATKKIIIHK